ncbi:cupin domain-containing protein [Solimonas soli]|uniref:cupin domain-containing protein n=1 Tax=Solimonas soli TaxID=413479 RepID=UPI0009FE9839|nr:cupin domain-containing protein [Solimonas soli]
MIDLGMSDAEFRASRLERGFLHHKAAVLAPHPTWRDVDTLLHAVDPRTPFVQLFQHGRVQDGSTYLEEDARSVFGRVSLSRRRLYQALSGGATLVLNRLESFMPFAAHACQNLGERMGMPATANAYLSFSHANGGEATFGAHWDTHDVFVLQLLGRKRWRVYEPTWLLPHSSQTSQGSRHRRPTVPVFECILEAGDLLYLPRGWWHEVEASDQTSFHLSVGLYPKSVADYVQWTAMQVLPALYEARKSLELSTTFDLQMAIRTLAAALGDPAHLAAFRRESAGHRSAPSPLDLELLSGEATLHEDDKAQLVSGVVHRAIDGEVHVDARLHLDADKKFILSALAKKGPLSIGALCSLLGKTPSDVVRRALIELFFDDAIILRRR